MRRFLGVIWFNDGTRSGTFYHDRLEGLLQSLVQATKGQDKHVHYIEIRAYESEF